MSRQGYLSDAQVLARCKEMQTIPLNAPHLAAIGGGRVSFPQNANMMYKNLGLSQDQLKESIDEFIDRSKKQPPVVFPNNATPQITAADLSRQLRRQQLLARGVNIRPVPTSQRRPVLADPPTDDDDDDDDDDDPEDPDEGVTFDDLSDIDSVVSPAADSPDTAFRERQDNPRYDLTLQREAREILRREVRPTAFQQAAERARSMIARTGFGSLLNPPPPPPPEGGQGQVLGSSTPAVAYRL